MPKIDSPTDPESMIPEQVIAPDPVPVLTEQQNNYLYMMIIPNFSSTDVKELSGKLLLTVAEHLVDKAGSTNLNKIKNNVFRFLVTSEIGDYLWLGHTQPIFVRIRDQHGNL